MVLTYAEKPALRFTTTGSVDDGKSTLIGRLLYESQAIFEDQLQAVAKTSARQHKEQMDLSLLLDGLSAEREQGITIDVAYRYFSTPRRRFIIADTPGHEQYTRNMVTGASQCQAAIILIDARHGVKTQSRRHGFLLSLLGIPHLIVAVNKMDLVDYDANIYQNIVNTYSAFSKKLSIQDIRYLPVSALKGDNVTTRSQHMPWYEGATLLHTLETLEVAADRNLVDFRFPVQYVIRPHQDFRGYAGKVASGQIRPGEAVMVLPGGQRSTVQRIVTYDGDLTQANAGESVTLTLEDELDLSRGDMLVRPSNQPQSSRYLNTMMCWLDTHPMQPGKTYLLKHTTRNIKARISKLHYRMNVNTLQRESCSALQLNDIGRIDVHTTEPLFFDAYMTHPHTGRFILIDPDTGQTSAAGMIKGEIQSLDSADELSHWATRNTHKAAVIWLTGLSGAGKSTLARALKQRLFERFCQVMTLDGDQLRTGLCADLGFSAADRSENIRRAGEVARLFFNQGNLVICSFISPFREDRARLRKQLPEGGFIEVHVNCALEVCQQRDPKGLYQRALNGEIPDFTGIDSPYEAPEQPEVVVDTAARSVTDCAESILQYLQTQHII